MTINVTLSNTGKVGTSYPSDFDDFVRSFVSSGFPYMEEDDQIIIIGEGDGADTKIFILNGDNLAYDLGSHTVSGELDEVIVATLGDSFNDDGTFDLDSDGHIVNYDALIAFDNLDLSNSSSVRGDVHEIVAELMYLGSGDDRGTEVLDDALNGEAQHVEGSAGNDNYTGTPYDDTIYGNDGRDVILGGNGDDVIYGGDGIDVLVGSAGDDTLYGEEGNDKLRGRWGDDVLHGGEGDDQLLGNTDDDQLFGGAGNDQLIGGIGADTLDGGPGNDVFHYRTADEPDGDVIADFGDGADLISLRRFDANTSTAGKDGFTIIGDDDFSGAGGELQIVVQNGDSIVSGDVSGDGEADFTFTVLNVTDLTASDFLI
ncbi:hypothetical protein DLJ53_25320 [Acuticoccus sediminis]|uniref:Hemolysin type calcium-binding protein n=1 Tax=Acuticoccus sediminis TaxID=2184697 RepID=A0A8B2NTP2_9HYPH|nr:hypothetical protein [Acuticoccus sediminis]RAH98953.1 hypothetical protein DLJ53_25320 [Acuticoccus sediminis]